MKGIGKTLVALTVALATSLPLHAQQAPGRMSAEQRIEVLERQVRNLTELLMQVDTLTREMQQLRGEVEVQGHSMDALKERQRDLYLDLDKRLNKLQQGAAAGPSSYTPPTTNTGATRPAPASSISTSGSAATTVPSDLPPGDPAEEGDRYQAAFNLLREGKYGEAATALRTFLVQYPDSPKADNAQYWLAEAGYVTKDYQHALDDFTALVERYPASPKVADALLKSGYILYESEQYADARDLLEQVLNNHGDTTAAQLAQKQLDRMDREGR